MNVHYINPVLVACTMRRKYANLHQKKNFGALGVLKSLLGIFGLIFRDYHVA
jgi:hypothetical protein